MAATIEEVMTGIGDRLRTISGLRVTDYPPSSIVPPAAFPLIPDINYRETMNRATYTLEFKVVILTSAATDRSGLGQLMKYANPRGTSSVIVAFEEDKTLSGTVDDTIVDTFRPLGIEEVAAIGYYGGEFSIRVAASGAA